MPKNKIADTIDPAMGPIDGVGLKIMGDMKVKILKEPRHTKKKIHLLFLDVY